MLTEPIDASDPLFAFRKKWWERFQAQGALNADHEALRYLSLKSVAWPSKAKRPPVPSFDGTEYQIVFADGFFMPELSRVPPGVIVEPVGTAMRSFGVFLQSRWQRICQDERDPLACMNGVMQGEGAFLYVSPDTQIVEPLAIYHLAVAPSLASPRLSISLGANSSLHLVEEHMPTAHGCCNLVTDALLHDAARLTYHVRSTSAYQGTLLQHFRASLKRSACLNYRMYSEGASLLRNSIHVQLLGEESRAILKGLTDITDVRISHVNALVEHAAPHTYSRQHFKAVAGGSSRSTFEGKIYVHPEAQKTEAYQLSQSLLISDKASSFAKPNLEIFADDVKASHGATVSQVNEEELFYLRSRGFSLSHAKQCLMDSFVSELKECKEIR